MARTPDHCWLGVCLIGHCLRPADIEGKINNDGVASGAPVDAAPRHARPPSQVQFIVVYWGSVPKGRDSRGNFEVCLELLSTRLKVQTTTVNDKCRLLLLWVVVLLFVR
ncbi:hypothetical protein THAOC_14021 [Thalassiosira oceanica]|uniref:Uncharacterized protein n=1 Tax=Thalassiosira oceanica TaxID=159749 RepID=K0SGC0_THAOC|nr:hypothetical protein THAOC_14021 [Thalassiosira oceanica]|eukprot:EJK65163.1 hypothetical protein THAOC_14021 [Thalassiosira oceanica]